MSITYGSTSGVSTTPGLLDSDNKQLGADAALTAGATTTILTSKVLAVGTWLVCASLVFIGPTAGGEVEAAIAAGTATATGYNAASGHCQNVATDTLLLSIDALLVVTVAGTIVLTCTPGAGITGTLKARALSALSPGTPPECYLTSLRLL